jgi:hypothetical protein
VIPEWKPIEEPPLIPKAVWYVVPVILVAAAAGGYWYYTRQKEEPPPVAKEILPAPQPAAEPPPPAEPAVRNPVPGQSADVALPPLDESDVPLRGELAPLLGEKTLDQFLVPESLVRNIVATVDNLPRSKVAAERRPIKPTGGATVVETQGEEITLSAKNFERYTPFVTAVQSADAKKLADTYFHYYPLFQESYENLGYPDAYFNDRVVEVIDDLLATPIVQGPIRLTQPRVFYEYADPALEERSAGQKLMLRMGSANAGKIKAKLREFRALISKGPEQTETKAAE